MFMCLCQRLIAVISNSASCYQVLARYAYPCGRQHACLFLLPRTTIGKKLWMKNESMNLFNSGPFCV